MSKKYLFLLFSFMLFLVPSLAKDDDSIEAQSGAKKEERVEEYKSKDTGKLFLWKVKSETTTIHLLGSIHVGKKDMFPLDKAIQTAYSDASKLVLELDPTDPQTLMATQMTMIQKGMYQGGASIEDCLEANQIKKLKELLPKEIPGYKIAKKMKPWALSQLIQIDVMKKNGYVAKYGIDKHFMDKAKKEKKDILSLEKVSDQLDALTGGKAETHEKMFQEMLDNSDNIIKGIESIFEIWKNGDADGLYKTAIEKTIKEKEYMKAYFKRLNTDRNLNMLKKIESYLKSKENYFVIAGSLHMVGKEGLVNLLKDRGYEVTQVAKTKEIAKKEGSSKK